jgi:hypothetical protein
MPDAAPVELRIMVGHNLSKSPLKAMIVMEFGSLASSVIIASFLDRDLWNGAYDMTVDVRTR